MFIPTDAMTVDTLTDAMGGTVEHETRLERVGFAPLSDMMPVCGDDALMVADIQDARHDTSEGIDDAAMLASIRDWNGELDANL